jgi:trigger factor
MFKSSSLKITAILLVILSLAAVFTACGAEAVDPSIGSTKPYDYDLRYFVELGTYKGIEIGPYDITVADSDIQQQISYILDYYKGREEITEGIAESGNTVNIDYTGRVDGVEFAGGMAQGYDLTLGSGTFIPGFEDGIIGKTIGETFTVEVTFPEDYHSADLAGAAAEFEVVLNSVVIYSFPTYTDEFVSENFDMYKTKEELESAIRADLSAEKEANIESTKMDDAFNAVVENSTINKLPQIEVDRGAVEFKEMHTKEAANYGMTLDQYVTDAGITMAEFEMYAMEYAQNVVTGDLIVYSIAKAENITISEEEYAPMIQAYVDNMSDVESIAALEELYGRDYLEYTLLYDKVYNFIVANAVILE